MKSFKAYLEDTQVLMEMSNLRKYQTGLPVNIWVDDVGAERKTPHNLPRIKFQADKADKMHEYAIPMSISKKPEVLIKNYKTELSPSEISQIKSFVIKNQDVLMKYWRQEITLEELFKLIQKI